MSLKTEGENVEAKHSVSEAVLGDAGSDPLIALLTDEPGTPPGLQPSLGSMVAEFAVGREVGSVSDNPEVLSGRTSPPDLAKEGSTTVDGRPLPEPVSGKSVSSPAAIAAALIVPTEASKPGNAGVPHDMSRPLGSNSPSDESSIACRASNSQLVEEYGSTPVRPQASSIADVSEAMEGAITPGRAPSSLVNEGLTELERSDSPFAGHQPPMAQLHPSLDSPGQVQRTQVLSVPPQPPVALQHSPESSRILASVLSVASRAEIKAEPDKPTTSFWERFFSTPDSLTSSNSGSAVSGLQTSIAIEAGPVVEGGANDGPAVPMFVASAGEKEQPDTTSTKDRPAEGPKLTASGLSTNLPEVGASNFNGSVSGLLFTPWVADHPSSAGWTQVAESLALISPTHTPSTMHSGSNNAHALHIPQVASQLSDVLVRNSSTMTELALAPEELGHVRLRMEPDSANPDRMMIMISVERPETLDLFRRHAGELVDALRNAGYSGADIGFSQGGREERSEHQREPRALGTALPFDDANQAEVTPMRSVGASLDLRL
ncbi:flagellar hook-length control protein FliK [Rhodobacter sp. SY28-1]|uniref:flagellar hook-length control protein FliK n=1 Tax=Rhodobacter sp. SY28-1 TaxID=2562317 RepID=UPI001485857D|nr:flagellar hook-length control protein FliK [Rhodobacter sp. SY28-1]